MNNSSEQKFLKRVEELVGFNLSPQQAGYALGILSDTVAEANFNIEEADERAETEEIRANYRDFIKRSRRVVKG